MRPQSASQMRKSKSQPLQLKKTNIDVDSRRSRHKQKDKLKTLDLLSKTGTLVDGARRTNMKNRKSLRHQKTGGGNNFVHSNTINKKNRQRPASAVSIRRGIGNRTGHPKPPPQKYIAAPLRKSEISRLAASRIFDAGFQSQCIQLEVEFNEDVRHLLPPRSVTQLRDIESELDDVGTRSTRYHIYEKIFERLVTSQENLGAGSMGHLFRRVKIEYDRQISILTSAAFRKNTKTKNEYTTSNPSEIAATINNTNTNEGKLSESKFSQSIPKSTPIPTDDLESKIERMRLKIDHQQREISNFKKEQRDMINTINDKNNTIDEMQRTTIQWKTWAKKISMKKNVKKIEENNQINDLKKEIELLRAALAEQQQYIDWGDSAVSDGGDDSGSVSSIVVVTTPANMKSNNISNGGLAKSKTPPLTPTVKNNWSSGRPPRFSSSSTGNTNSNLNNSPLPSLIEHRPPSTLLAPLDTHTYDSTMNTTPISTTPTSALLPLSRSNVMLMNIPEGDEAMLSPTDGISERNSRPGSFSFSGSDSFSLGNYTGRSIGGKSEMSDASAMSVSPRIMPEGVGSKWDDEVNPDVPKLDFINN